MQLESWIGGIWPMILAIVGFRAAAVGVLYVLTRRHGHQSRDAAAMA